ncbi:hypothetical protein BJ968_004444 [Kineococcus aurantiacus]|uniref:Uncharacterized protein n=1 Tax=Kineococcus aurantiacus TaxID=37633 RepID=A0A7Y9DQG7_9ACTN|nr:hypothetical protein [Kineococcus aurantiacus]
MAGRQARAGAFSGRGPGTQSGFRGGRGHGPSWGRFGTATSGSPTP